MMLNDQIDIVQDSIVGKGVALIKEDDASYLSKLDDIQTVGKRPKMTFPTV